jgi:hypothetical protein
MRRTRVALVFAVSSLVAMGLQTSTAGAGSPSVPAFGRVFVIIGENTSLSQLKAKNTPYQITTIMPQSAWLTDFSATSHFSTSNYVGMTSGQYIECEQLDLHPDACNQDVENLFHELSTAGISWRSWMESMPEPCYLDNFGTSKDGNSYRPKHNPALYYANVEGEGGVWSAEHKSAECLANVLPMGGTGFNDTSAFESALAAGDVGRFNLIVPNQCEDGHDNCPPKGNGIVAYDDFLAREVPLIQDVMGPDDLLIVTYDEGQGGGPNQGDKFGGGIVEFAVMGDSVVPGIYGSPTNQYGFLRTMEDGFGITTHAGAAATTPPITQIWD